MNLIIKKCLVINEFRSKLLHNKHNFNTLYPMRSDPFQRNTLLYSEIRAKHACYRGARLYILF